MILKTKTHTIEVKAHITDWIWRLIPSVELSFDVVFFGIHLSFLCFNLFIDFTNESELSKWSARFDEESKQAYEGADS